MGMKVWINGDLVDQADAKISVFDHGLLYGDGVFEGLRAYNGRIFEEDAHVDRLYESARAIRLEIPIDKNELKKAMADTMDANGAMEVSYLRVVVTRGGGHLGLAPPELLSPAQQKKMKEQGNYIPPSVIVIADSIELYPAELYENGLSLVTVSTIRNHPNSLPPRIKSLNYLNNILAKIEAVDAGVPEAIMLNHEGLIAECSGDNIFIVRRGLLCTPPTSAGLLEGVTRDVVIQLSKKYNIPLEEKNLVRHDLYTADECFLTGTAAEVIPVTHIDKRPIGSGKPGPITRNLIADFHQYVRGGK